MDVERVISWGVATCRAEERGREEYKNDFDLISA